MTQEQQEQLAQLEETIRVAQLQIEELKKPKPKKFEWKYHIINGENFNAFGIDKTAIFTDCRNIPEYIEHGRYRLTIGAAKQSLARNQRANRLEALAEQLGGLKEFKYGNLNAYIYQNVDKIYEVFYSNNSNFNPCSVYMDVTCAKEICRMLNEGEFFLEGEL